MSNNLIRGAIDPSQLTVLVYCESDRIGGLLQKSLNAIGCSAVMVVTDESQALSELDAMVPKLVIIVSDITSPEKLAIAQRINKKRVVAKGRTPKILGLIGPGIDDIIKAKSAGFFDVLPLPIAPNSLFDRLETVLTRID